MQIDSSPDYFGRFFNEDGFDFCGLVDADFLTAIRVLYQNRLYVSAAKLLVVAVDSVGYVEFGNSVRNPFTSWLNKFCNLNNVNISSDELWEHRNALLHMSILDSRKITRGESRRLIMYVGDIPNNRTLENSDTGYYNLQKLILEFIDGVGRWAESYNEDRTKIDIFVLRYDQVVSDLRMLEFKHEQDM